MRQEKKHTRSHAKGPNLQRTKRARKDSKPDPADKLTASAQYPENHPLASIVPRGQSVAPSPGYELNPRGGRTRSPSELGSDEDAEPFDEAAAAAAAAEAVSRPGWACTSDRLNPTKSTFDEDFQMRWGLLRKEERQDLLEADAREIAVAKSISRGESQAPPNAAEKMLSMSVRDLRNKARQLGVAEERLEAVVEGKDPKKKLIRMILRL